MPTGYNNDKVMAKKLADSFTAYYKLKTEDKKIKEYQQNNFDVKYLIGTLLGSESNISPPSDPYFLEVLKREYDLLIRQTYEWKTQPPNDDNKKLIESAGKIYDDATNALEELFKGGIFLQTQSSATNPRNAWSR